MVLPKMRSILLTCVIAWLAAPQSVPREKTIPEIAREADGAVVSVIMTDKQGGPVVQASGFVVSNDGRIVTNYHVIRQGTSAIVKLPDGAFFVVDGLLTFDKARDIAVIKAHGKAFRTVKLGDSNETQVGEQVVAIGNPLSLESTVSNGIVSGIREEDGPGSRFLQVTTPISPGSSGGPLFNMSGEVIGITTFYLKGGENLNFAIPVNDAKPLLKNELSKIQSFPDEPEANTQSESAGTASEGHSRSSTTPRQNENMTGQFGGVVHNLSANLSAPFGIIVNEVGGTFWGCMEVQQPLFGSGPLYGRAEGSRIKFSVVSAIGTIKFVGQLHDDEISGTYTVEHQSLPDELGDFTLNKAKSKGLPAHFNTANCPTDAEVHK